MSLAPELADRLAKMLRPACDRAATEGEKIAAIGKISAIAAAQGIDWDLALANGAGPALTEEQLSRVFWEGHARGVIETEQRLRPARDWTPAADTSSEAGENTDRLKTILKAAAESAAAGLLSEWEATFAADMLDRFKKFGSRIYVSEKQWACLDKL